MKQVKKINFNNVSFGYTPEKNVFHNLNLNLCSSSQLGYVVVIMGSSGAGKSTLVKLILDLKKPSFGNISITPNNPVYSYVPQKSVLFEHLSIEQNAKYFSLAGGHKKRYDQNLYDELVDSLELADVLSSKKSILELSGGQQQRISLLRALSIKPDFLVLDEPCNGLDATVKRSFLNKLKEITHRYNLFVLYITHHKSEAQILGDDILYLVQDKSSKVVKNTAKSNVLDFANHPPTLDAAEIFLFPDIKILPIKEEFNDDDFEITKSKNEIKEYWLIKDEDIIITKNGKIEFTIISKSSVYTVIGNKDYELEWMTKIDLSDYSIGDVIQVNINKPKIKYSN